MPYQSRSQQRAFHAKLNRGEISESTVKEWDEASKGKKLPDRLPPKKSSLGKWAKKRATDA